MKTIFDLAVEKMKRYCVYRERSHSEVRTKLIKDKIFGDDLEEIMSLLIQADFLNEERYAKAYTKGKFNQNHWGKVKITQGLKKNKVSDYCIREAMKEIDEETYLKVIHQLRIKKERLLRVDSDYEKQQKTTRYLLTRGFEMEMIKKSYHLLSKMQ